MFTKKHFILIISIIIAFVLVSFVLYSMSYQPSLNNQDNSGEQEQNSDSNSENKPVINTTPIKPIYDEALKIYANRRIQFDQNCVASPNTATFKKGTIIMLDNRSSLSRTIALGNLKYTVKAYDFALVTLTTTYPLPHIILVDCGTKQNTATINLQQ